MASAPRDGSYDAGGGDFALADYARSLARTSGVKEAEFRLGEQNARALTDTSIARGAAMLDPMVRAQQAKGMDAYDRIDPSAIQRLGGDARDIAARAEAGVLARQAMVDAQAAQGRDAAALARQRAGAAVDAVGAMAGVRGPSVADLAAQQQRERGQAAIVSTLASQGGYSPAAQAAAMRALGQQGADIAGSTAIARAQEEQAALSRDLAARTTAAQGYSQLAESERAQQGTDLAAAQQAQAGLLSATSAQAGLLGQEGQFLAGADQQRAALFDAAQRARMQQEQQTLAQMQFRAGGPQRPGVGEMIGSGLGLAGGIAGSIAGAFSDERVKRNVSTGDSAVGKMLGALAPKSWRYKPGYEDGGEREHIGVMAQALEKSDLGRTMVHKDADGTRIVDYSPRTMGPIVLAALAHLSRRLDKRGA